MPQKNNPELKASHLQGLKYLKVLDPVRFHELQTLPDPNGNDVNWLKNYLLATPSEDWIATIFATRALIELKAAEAIPRFVELLFKKLQFPRLSAGIEAEQVFAPFGEIAIEPM